MFQQFYSRSELMTWPVVGLIIFMTAFIAVLLIVFIGMRNSRTVDHMANLPLEDDAAPEIRQGGE
jgi:hypothetical protein